MNIKRSFVSISTVTAMLLLTACSSGGSNKTSLVDETETPDTQTPVAAAPALNISGIISDGPIYDASVEIFDPTTNTVLGATTSSAEADTIGGYELSLTDAPETFIIKSKGGRDSGPDGLINANDRVNQSEMKTVAKKPANEEEEVTANATPATTLIAGFVEEQAAAGEDMNLEAAQEVVTKALGLPEGTDLVSANPKTDKVAAKAASFVANIIDSLPSGSADNSASFKSVGNVFKQNSDTGTSVANITADTVAVTDSFSVAEIAKDIVKQDATAINASAIAKLEKSDATIGAQIESVVKISLPVDEMTATEKIQAVATEQTLDILNTEIDNTIDASALLVTELEKIVFHTQAVLTQIMTRSDSGVEAVDTTNIDLLASVIKENIDNIDKISSDTFNDVAQKSQEMAKEIAETTSEENAGISNSIVKNMFTKLDLTQENALASVEKVAVADIVTISETIIEKSTDSSTDAATQENFTDTMTDIIASSITNNLSDEAPLDFSAIADSSVNNAELVETVTELAVVKAEVEVKIEALQEGESLSSADLSAVIAGDTITKSISDSFAKSDFVYDAAVADNFDAIKESIAATVETAITDTVAGEAVDVTKAVTAAEATTSLVDATATDFSVESFESINETVTAAIETAVESGGDAEVDVSATVDALVEKIEVAVESGTDLADAVNQESEKVTELVEIATDLDDVGGTTETGDETSTETGDETSTETGDETSTETGDENSEETGDENSEETGDENSEETGDENSEETGNENSEETNNTPTGETPAAATTKIVSVTAAGSDTATLDATYNFTAGTYAYAISNFSAGDILNLPAGNLPTIGNIDFTDGIVDVIWAYDGNVISVRLTGLSTATDATIYGVDTFRTAYGSTSLNPIAITDTSAVSVTATGSSDAVSGDITYTFNTLSTGSYTYTIDNFATGDVLDFPAGNNPTIINSNFEDNATTVQWANAGSVIQVNLTNITDDSSIYGLDTFKSTFGTNSVQ